MTFKGALQPNPFYDSIWPKLLSSATTSP